jgi:hypothetical protein
MNQSRHSKPGRGPVGTEKSIYRAEVWQRMRTTSVDMCALLSGVFLQLTLPSCRQQINLQSVCLFAHRSTFFLIYGEDIVLRPASRERKGMCLLSVQEHRTPEEAPPIPRRTQWNFIVCLFSSFHTVSRNYRASVYLLGRESCTSLQQILT